MDEHNPLDPARDPFGPPAVPTPVSCIHCGEEFDSYRLEWRVEPDAEGKSRGFWRCPTQGCHGVGFGFDIWPTNPDYHDERGIRGFADDHEAEEYPPEVNEMSENQGEDSIADDSGRLLPW